MKKNARLIIWASFLFILSCNNRISIIHHFSIDSNDVISNSLAIFEPNKSFDKNGSLNFSITKPTVIELYELEDIKEDNCVLIYSAAIKTENWEGSCYLEMWCFVNGGSFFSRSLEQAITHDTDWKLITTPFFLKKGQVVDKIKLNVVADGSGELWIDSIDVLKRK